MKHRSLRSTLRLVLVGLLMLPGMGFAMTSANYQVPWDSVNSGGGDTSTSTNFQLRDTIGEQATGFSESSSYRLGAGYRVGDSQEASLSLVIGTQENDTQVIWTNFSDGSETVSVAATSSFTVGDYIGVVENIGASQLVAVGKIASISGADIVVESWGGEPGSLSASASGGDDYVYRLGGGAAALGAQSLSAVASAVSVIDVTSNVPTGYSVTVQASSTLQNASGLAISDVLDGVVSVGSEEYGGEAVGTTAQGGGIDFAFPTGTPFQVQAASSTAQNDLVGILYKLSITAGTASGDYRQTLFYRLTPNY